MADKYVYNPLVRNACSRGLGRLRQPHQPVIDPARRGFIQWITDNFKKGLWMHNSLCWLYNEQWDFGLGAPHTSGLTEETIIVKVPKSLILTPRSVSHPELRKILMESMHLDAMCKLALAYIFESCMREDSPFFHYLSYITFPDVPRLWKDDELEMLRGTEFEVPYEKSKKYLDDLFRIEVLPFLIKHQDILHPRVANVTYQAWCEAYITVESRAFQVDEELALVPICDLFNHAPSGEEDLEFICSYEPCITCRSTDPCNCLIPQDPAVMTEIATLDENGGGWRSMHAPILRRKPDLDCCTMTLVKDVTKVKQLFSNYGRFDNPQLLMTYGFLDYACSSDKVSLNKEVFLDLEAAKTHVELCLFWSEHGPQFLKEVSSECTRRESEEMSLLFSVHKSLYDKDFSSWCLAIGEDGWVRFPLKVWGILCTMSGLERKTFLKAPFEGKVDFMRWALLSMFDPQDNFVDLAVVKWIKWLIAAMDKRRQRLAVTSLLEYDRLYEEHLEQQKTASESEDFLGRKEKVFWILKRELTILTNCQRDAEETLELMVKRKREMEEDWEYRSNDEVSDAKRRKLL